MRRLAFATLCALISTACGGESNEGQSSSAASCGDGVCGAGETCASCQADCGPTCPGTSSGGSGAGTGGQGAGSGGTASSSGGSGGSVVIPGWPDDTNTGIPADACPQGLADATIDETEPSSGATIECVKFVDDVPYIRDSVSNVTYRFCRFETSSPDTFANIQGANVTFEDSEFAGGAVTWIRTSYEGHDLVVRRCDFSGMGNAVEFGTDGCKIEDNYIHDFGNASREQHADGIQSGEDTTNMSVKHNTVLLNEVNGSTSAINLGGTGAVADNLVAGGGYTVHVLGDLAVTGNHFSTLFYENCGSYDAVYPESLGAGSEWQGNVWHDGPKAGQSIPAP